MALFNGKANCATCHAGFNFTDESFHNLGVGMDAAEPGPRALRRRPSATRTGAFKTPTLRDVPRTPPYMHDGSRGDAAGRWSSSTTRAARTRGSRRDIKPLNLDEQEKSDLVAFLQALTGDVEHLVRKPTSRAQ